jgi:hypothetical protein
MAFEVLMPGESSLTDEALERSIRFRLDCGIGRRDGHGGDAARNDAAPGFLSMLRNNARAHSDVRMDKAAARPFAGTW